MKASNERDQKNVVMLNNEQRGKCDSLARTLSTYLYSHHRVNAADLDLRGKSQDRIVHHNGGSVSAMLGQKDYKRTRDKNRTRNHGYRFSVCFVTDRKARLRGPLKHVPA